MIDYRSDNTGRAAPEILEALVASQQRHRARLRRRRMDRAAAGPLRRIVRDPGAGLPGGDRHRRQRPVAGGAQPVLGPRLLQRAGAHQHLGGQCRRVLRRRPQARAGRPAATADRPGGAARYARRRSAGPTASRPAGGGQPDAGDRSRRRLHGTTTSRAIAEVAKARGLKAPHGRRPLCQCAWRGSAAARPT